MIKRYALIFLNLILLGCVPSQILNPSSQKHLSLSQVITQPSQYSTEKGKALAVRHKENIKNIFDNIRARYNNIEFTPLTKIKGGGFTSGIGFFKEDIKEKNGDHRYFGISVGTDDSYYVDNELPINSAEGIENVYIKHVRNLLILMTGEKEILDNDDVEGISIRLAWFNQVSYPSSTKIVGMLVRASKDDAYNYSRMAITTQEFLSKSEVFQFGQYISLQKIKLNIASVSKDSTVHVSALPLSKIIETLPQNTEVQIIDYKNDFFEFSNYSRYISKESFVIKGILKSLIQEYELAREIAKKRKAIELIIAQKKKEIETDKNWIIPLTANIRASNSMSSPVIDELEHGEYVFIQEHRNNWYRVFYSGPN